jgi:predicted RNA-binding protein
LDVSYINILADNREYVDILDAFSKRNVTGKIEKTDLKIFDFMEIKKNPLFRASDEYNRNLITYLILDNKLLLEKTYSLFINDFWFDYLKPFNICNRNDWGNFIRG